MPRSVRKFGTNIFRPGVITYHNLDGLINLDLGDVSAVMIIGEADAGQPQATASTPVVHAFTDPQDMIDYFVSGNLAEAARCLFDPAMDGQLSVGVPLRGCQTVYAIKTNQSTQGSYTLQDGSSNNAVTIKGRLWGALDNQTWFKIETSGTGKILTCGRDVAPNVGSQVSVVFGATGVDEWLNVQYTGAAATATMSFDGTTFTTTTAGSVDDLSITATGKTMSELATEITAAPSGDYTATVARADRLNILSTYMDRFSGVNIKSPTTGTAFGIAYDITEWCNSNSDYVEATWVGGYEPTTYGTTYLAGGALGVTTSTTIIRDALKVASRFSPRFVVSGYNDDVGTGGAVALSSVNAEFTTHATNCNAIGAACERQVFICTNDTTKAALYTTLGAINNEYVSALNNEIYREDETNNRAWLGVHCAAATAAATMAGSPIATPLTHRYIKGHDVRFVATDFDTSDNTDFYNGILYGLLFLEVVPGTGIRWAKGISTYRLEDNDGRIALEVVEARIRHKIILRRALDIPEIGHKGRGIRTTDSIYRRVIEAHRQLADPDDPDFILVEGTDVDGNIMPAYRNIRVSLSGDQINVTGELTFTQGINWIFNDFRATLPQATTT